MKDFKILYLGKYDIYRINQEIRWIRESLKKLCHVDEYGVGYKILDTHPKLFKRGDCVHDLKKLYDEYKPDVILIHQRKKEIWFNRDQIPVPCASIMWDNHGFREERCAWLNNEKIDMTLFRSKGFDHVGKAGIKWWKDNLWNGHKIRWMPAACNLEVYKDYGYEREYDICLIGRSHASTYPLRHLIYKHFRNPDVLDLEESFKANKKYKIMYHKRHKRSWGWDQIMKDKYGCVSGLEYGQAIAKCKIMPTGCSLYGYAVNKYFEAPGCYTALAANMPQEGPDLGFIPDENFIHIAPKNFAEKIDYYLENEDERMKIAIRARKLMETRHSVKIRAHELLQNLEELTSQNTQ